MKKIKKHKLRVNKRSRNSIRKRSCTTKNTQRSTNVDDFIDESVIPSPYSVFVAVFVMQDDEPIKLIKFETDLNVIRKTIEFTTSGRYFRSDPRVTTHPRLVSLIMNSNEPKDDLNTIIINYISYFEAEVALDAFPEQSIGYFLYFDVNDHEKCVLKGGLRHNMEQMFNDIGVSFENSFDNSAV